MKMKKIFGLVATMLAALVMATAFTACSDDDDDDGPSVVAQYTDPSSEGLYVFMFYSDGTLKFGNWWGDDVGFANLWGEGTYSGTLSDNGSISITITHRERVELASPNTQAVTITEGEFDYDYGIWLLKESHSTTFCKIIWVD